MLYDVADRVATVTLNRPEVHNALNFELRRDLVAALRRAEADPDVTVVFLKGAGKSFCAARDRSTGSGEGRSSDGTIRDSLAWMNRAADEVGLL